MSTKFIFVDKATGTLYISPEISDNQHDYTNPEDATVPFSHPQQGPSKLFQVHNADSFRKVCKEAQGHCGSASGNDAPVKTIPPVEELPLKDAHVPQADKYIFILNGRLVPAPSGWDGTITNLYECINNAVQIAQALNTPPTGQESRPMSYNQVLKISSAELDTIYGFLNANSAEEYQSENQTIIYTVRFPDGKEMDMKCCGCQDNPSWTEAVLFDTHGNQLACSEDCEGFLGPWELEYGGITYAVNVVAADDGYVPPKTDQESICPVCGAELEEYEAHEILDNGGVIPWECSHCGATGEEGYTRVFDAHYHVCFANGDSVPGHE